MIQFCIPDNERETKDNNGTWNGVKKKKTGLTGKDPTNVNSHPVKPPIGALDYKEPRKLQC